MYIKFIGEEYFSWHRWRSGDIKSTLGVKALRYELITKSPDKDIIQKYAVGYCPGEKLRCRPKLNETSVMFFKDGIHFWFHFRNNEFNKIFKENNGK